MSLQGEDLSHWQSTGTVDGSPDFVILKATGGDSVKRAGAYHQNVN